MFVGSNAIPTNRDTGFNEPLSTQRNTTLPHPEHVDAPPVVDEEHAQQHVGDSEHVGIATKIKGEVKIIEGKILHNQRMVEEGKAIKHGIPLEGK